MSVCFVVIRPTITNVYYPDISLRLFSFVWTCRFSEIFRSSADNDGKRMKMRITEMPPLVDLNSTSLRSPPGASLIKITFPIITRQGRLPPHSRYWFGLRDPARPSLSLPEIPQIKMQVICSSGVELLKTWKIKVLQAEDVNLDWCLRWVLSSRFLRNRCQLWIKNNGIN